MNTIFVNLTDLITLASAPKTENDNLITSSPQPFTSTQIRKESNTHSDVRNFSENDKLENGNKEGND